MGVEGISSLLRSKGSLFHSQCHWPPRASETQGQARDLEENLLTVPMGAVLPRGRPLGNLVKHLQ